MSSCTTVATCSDFPATKPVEATGLIKSLLVRGMLAGLVAGLLALAFASLFGEPQVGQAIAVESQIRRAAGGPADPVLVSRAVQRSVGLATAVCVYGAAFGGLFALVFAVVYGRIGR